MMKLIMAEIYKETRKVSFKIFVLLIIFVSIFSLIIINKNLNMESEQINSYPLYSQDEYKSVNKYGSYEQYLEGYREYERVVNNEIIRLESNKETKADKLFSYYPTFLFLIGIIVIYMSFHTLSYDYQSKSIRYLFMSSKGRSMILLSKVISVILFSVFFSMIMFLTFLVVVYFLANENLLLVTKGVYFGDTLMSVPIIIFYLFKTFVYLIPMIFIATTTIFMTTLLKGSTFALIISNVIYFCSLLFSQLLINYGYTFISYTFLPYMDYTYFESPTTVQLNNLIYNIDLSIINGISILMAYGLVFLLFSLKLIKRDV